MVLPAKAFSVPENVTTEYKATPEIEAQLQICASEISDCLATGTTKSSRVVRRAYQDGTDTYTLIIANTGVKITDLFSIKTASGSELTFEEAPLYVVEYCLRRTDINGNETAKVECMLSWPAKCLFYDGVDDRYVGDFDITTVTEMANAKSINPNLCNYFSFYATGQVMWVPENYLVKTYAIISNQLNPKHGIYSSVNGISQLEFAAPENGNVSNLTFNRYDAETGDIQTDADFYFRNMTGREFTVYCEYDGDYLENGFEAREYRYNFHNIHIINYGEFTTTSSENKFMFDFEPVNRYWIAMPGEYNDIELNPSLKWMEPVNIPFVWHEGTTQDLQISNNFCAMSGTVFTPVDYDICEGGRFDVQYTTEMKDLIEGMPQYGKSLYMIPKAWSIVPWNVKDSANSNRVYEWSDYFGWYAVWRGSTWQCTSAKSESKIVLFTEDGIIFDGYDQYGNHYIGNYKGIVYYHNNRENIHDYVEVSAIGTYVDAGVDNIMATDGVSVFGHNGVITVSSEEAVNVSVYTLSGTCVASKNIIGSSSINVGKGTYVVKAGAKAVKIMM